MFKQNKFIRALITIMPVFMMVGFTGCSNIKNKELDSSYITVITKVTPNGEVGYAMVCDFGSNVDSSKLSESSFAVEATIGDKTEPRKITKVYTNDKIEISDTSKQGRYVLIELDSKDANASTLMNDSQTFLSIRNELKYTVTQKTDIKTSDNTTFKASEKKIANGKEVTPVVDEFKKLSYKDESGKSINYRLFEPQTETNKKYPLVLFLHGSGERGDNNDVQLLGNMGAIVWATLEEQVKNPCYVLAPQASAEKILNAYWVTHPNYDMVLGLVKETIQKYQIDPSRVYVVGMSNGGIGTFNMLLKNSDLFAAGVSICGAIVRESEAANEFLPGIYNKPTTEEIEILKDIPIWAFSAADDPLIDVRNSRDIVAGVKEAGGDLINYTEYPAEQKNGHGSWIPALQNQDMINWLFNQSKK